MKSLTFGDNALQTYLAAEVFEGDESPAKQATRIIRPLPAPLTASLVEPARPRGENTRQSANWLVPCESFNPNFCLISLSNLWDADLACILFLETAAPALRSERHLETAAR
eukprot:2545976-Pyramimonas_sp.AAC.2